MEAYSGERGTSQHCLSQSQSILYLSKQLQRSDQILTCMLSVCSSISFWCVCVCLYSVKASAGWGLCWLEMCCFVQIRPSDGGYGFTLEEKNRVPIIKSVEKGSPAEVRLCTHACSTTHGFFLFCALKLSDNGDKEERGNLLSRAGYIKLDVATQLIWYPPLFGRLHFCLFGTWRPHLNSLCFC